MSVASSIADFRLILLIEQMAIPKNYRGVAFDQRDKMKKKIEKEKII